MTSLMKAEVHQPRRSCGYGKIKKKNSHPEK